MMRILLTGGTGQVGRELQRTLKQLGEVMSPDRSMFDLGKPETLRSKIREWKPDLIVNPAAYTSVDKAENESKLVFTVNADSPCVLAEEAERLKIPLIHYSTDYVFNGENAEPYKEEDMPSPINVYGESKLKGEELIKKSCEQYLILRTSWIYDLRGNNFLTTMRRLFLEREELSIVCDQIGAPTCSKVIAEATATIIEMLKNNSKNELLEKEIWGLYHLSARNETSWYGFAKAILEKENLNKILKLHSIKTKEYPTPAQRPMYSLLDNKKIFNKFGIQLPDWKESLSSLLN